MRFKSLCKRIFESIDLNMQKQIELDHVIQSFQQALQIYVTPIITNHNNEQVIELSNLRAKKDAPQGSGSAFMKELCKWADVYRVVIILQTATKGDFDSKDQYKKTTSMNRLKKFYSQFGFVSNYGKRTYRSDLSGNMHRIPKG